MSPKTKFARSEVSIIDFDAELLPAGWEFDSVWGPVREGKIHVVFGSAPMPQTATILGRI